MLTYPSYPTSLRLAVIAGILGPNPSNVMNVITGTF